MDLQATILISSGLGLLSVILGVIASGIYTRLTREPARGCDQCGAKLGTTEGTSCAICVGRRRRTLDTIAERDQHLKTMD